jgi:hypothetical protein
VLFAVKIGKRVVIWPDDVINHPTPSQFSTNTALFLLTQSPRTTKPTKPTPSMSPLSPVPSSKQPQSKRAMLGSVFNQITEITNINNLRQFQATYDPRQA